MLLPLLRNTNSVFTLLLVNMLLTQRFKPSFSLVKHLQYTATRCGTFPYSTSKIYQSTTTTTTKSSSPHSSSLLVELNQENEKDQTYTTLSFYKFANPKLTNVESIVNKANEKLNDHQFFDKLKGTLIFAEEGVNAQITVNTKYLHQLQQCINSDIDSFLNNIQFNIGETRTFANQLPFKRLIVRSKKQILTDGLTYPSSTSTSNNNQYLNNNSMINNSSATSGLVIEWNEEAAGPELSGEEWHKEISNLLHHNNHNKDNIINNHHINNNDDDDESMIIKDRNISKKTILLDCRNDYESDMGTFQNAIPLNTTKFSDSWPILDTLLENIPKDTRILTFCTGGIRCVKINAYLRQKLNFENTARLQDGIIGYERWFENNQQQTLQQVQVQMQAPPAQEVTNELETSSSSLPVSMPSAIISAKTDDITTTTTTTTTTTLKEPLSSSSSSSPSSSSLFQGKNFVFDRRRLIDGTPSSSATANTSTTATSSSS